MSTPEWRAHFALYWGVYAGIAGAILIIAGSAYWNYETQRQQGVMFTWPTVRARIVESEVRDSARRKTDNNLMISVNLLLHYTVDGVKRETRFVRSWRVGTVNDYAAELAVGNEILIHYSPKDPQVVFLEP